METEKLLKVPDLPEDEQRIEIAKLLSPKPWPHKWGYSHAACAVGKSNIAIGDCWCCDKCGREEILNREATKDKFIPGVLDNQAGKPCSIPDEFDGSLADLAFRLRDEVCKDSLSCDNYHNALRIVYQSFRKSQEGTVRQNMVTYTLWLESLITPIERIIAALIA